MEKKGESRRVILSLFIVAILCLGLISVSYASTQGSGASGSSSLWSWIKSLFSGITGAVVTEPGDEILVDFTDGVGTEFMGNETPVTVTSSKEVFVSLDVMGTPAIEMVDIIIMDLTGTTELIVSGLESSRVYYLYDFDD